MQCRICHLEDDTVNEESLCVYHSKPYDDAGAIQTIKNIVGIKDSMPVTDEDYLTAFHVISLITAKVIALAKDQNALVQQSKILANTDPNGVNVIIAMFVNLSTATFINQYQALMEVMHGNDGKRSH